MAEVNSQNISSTDADINLASIIGDDTSRYHIKWPVKETGTLYQTLLNVLEDRDELTIAVLGSSEIGKSLIIYSLLGYLGYPSFEDAYNSNEFAKLIARSQIGQANTQLPKTYVFRLKNGKRLRIVDNPGMGKGKKVDQQHLQNILNHFEKLETIDMICFVLKANDNRATAEFHYVLEELVKNFNRDITKHFAFCFTYGSTCYFRTTGAKATVQDVFNEWSRKSDIHIQVTDKNSFCVDNKPSKALMDKPKATNFDTNGFCWDYSGKGWKSCLLCARDLGKYNTGNILALADGNHTVTQLTTVLDTVTEQPTEGLLDRIQDWLRRIGIDLQICARGWRFWCILGLMGIVILALWRVVGGDAIIASLHQIIEIAARIQAFIQKQGMQVVSRVEDIFLDYLIKLKQWVDKEYGYLVGAFDNCQSFSACLGTLIEFYKTCLEQAGLTNQTPQDIEVLHEQLYAVPHFGPGIRAAINNRPKNDQADGNDDEIIQLVLEE